MACWANLDLVNVMFLITREVFRYSIFWNLIQRSGITQKILNASHLNSFSTVYSDGMIFINSKCFKKELLKFIKMLFFTDLQTLVLEFLETVSERQVQACLFEN